MLIGFRDVPVAFLPFSSPMILCVTAVRSYPLDQDLIKRFDETVDDKSDVYRLPDIKDESASRIELSVEL
ncbi:hypothetical protein BDZ94DRAFT_1262561 [Collybia nuda]|uniref:Uncharacterized protein n=1 Tax=Collybia nuda TaxID=64659 RepID=A0A9P5Y3D5_9AGAR|nr:hypothetical protein BDZ94DRAFT_1262561 [Collybia nuda]